MFANDNATVLVQDTYEKLFDFGKIFIFFNAICIFLRGPSVIKPPDVDFVFDGVVLSDIE